MVECLPRVGEFLTSVSTLLPQIRLQHLHPELLAACLAQAPLVAVQVDFWLHLQKPTNKAQLRVSWATRQGGFLVSGTC